jgi:hypothetical protein
MPSIHPIVAGSQAVPQSSTYVVMVGDEVCTVRATTVRPIADVLAAPEAEILAWEEMAALGVVDLAGDLGGQGLGIQPLSGSMIAAPRPGRRQRAVSSRGMFFGSPRS